MDFFWYFSTHKCAEMSHINVETEPRIYCCLWGGGGVVRWQKDFWGSQAGIAQLVEHLPA